MSPARYDVDPLLMVLVVVLIVIVGWLLWRNGGDGDDE